MFKKFFILLVFLPVFCYAKNIALTFDDGPSAKYTQEITAVLKANNAKATFFVIGGCVKNRPEVLKAVFADGNEIGNHTYTHPKLSALDDDAIAKELTRTNDLVYSVIHVRPTLFRPPFGILSPRIRKVVASLGMKVVTWDFMIDDYNAAKMTPEIISSAVIKHAHNGAIIDMHDGGGDREKTVQALPIIISELKKQGYQFVTVSQLQNLQRIEK